MYVCMYVCMFAYSVQLSFKHTMLLYHILFRILTVSDDVCVL